MKTEHFLADMENDISVTSAAFVKSGVKSVLWTYNIFVKSLLSVTIFIRFLSNTGVKVRIDCKKMGSNGQKGFTYGYHRGIIVVMLMEMVLFA